VKNLHKRLGPNVFFRISFRILESTKYINCVKNDVRCEWILTAGLALRENSAALSLAHSIVEVTITLFVILVRTANGYTGYREIRSAIGDQQDFDPYCDTHVRRVHRLMVIYVVGGALLFAIALAFFFVFFHLFDLGWTTLTNNCCLVTILVMWIMYSTMVDITAVKIREDQFKVWFVTLVNCWPTVTVLC